MPEPEFQPGPPLNYLVYGPPGTGKRTYASQLAVSLADQVPLAAFFMQARALRIADGPDEVHRQALAKLELARYLPPREHRIA